MEDNLNKIKQKLAEMEDYDIHVIALILFQIANELRLIRKALEGQNDREDNN